MSECSSEDSVHDSPVVKKKRATRSTRGFTKEVAVSQAGPAEEAGGIYSSQIGMRMAQMWAGQADLHFASDSDDGDDVGEWVPVTVGSQAPVGGEKVPEDPPSNAVTIDSEDEETLQTSDRTRSPTPPPTPQMVNQNRTRRKRQPKAVKLAMADMERAKVVQHIQTLDEKNDVLIIDDIASPSPEKSLPVRINSRSGIHKFHLKKNESFSGIFQAMACQEDVTEDRIVMFLRDKTVQPFDKPGDVHLHIADIIECHILRAGESVVSHELDPDDPEVLKIGIQGKDPKSKMLLHVHKREPLERVIQEFAKKQKLDYGKLSFMFDGESIAAEKSAGDLDMDEDDIIDVIEIQQ